MSNATSPADRFPRVPQHELPEPLATDVAAIEKRVGYVNDLFLLQAHVPASVPAFMAYTQAVKAPLSDRLNQLVALAACAALQATAESIQHERLSLRLGLSREFIAAAQGRPGHDASVLSPDEQAVRSLVGEIVSRLGVGCEPALAALAQAIGAGPAMAVLLQATRFIMIGIWGHVFDLRLPVPSIFDEAPQ